MSTRPRAPPDEAADHSSPAGRQLFPAHDGGLDRSSGPPGPRPDRRRERVGAQDLHIDNLSCHSRSSTLNCRTTPDHDQSGATRAALPTGSHEAAEGCRPGWMVPCGVEQVLSGQRSVIIARWPRRPARCWRLYQAGLDGGQASFEIRDRSGRSFSAARLPGHRHVAADAATGRCSAGGGVGHLIRRVYAGRDQAQRLRRPRPAGAASGSGRHRSWDAQIWTPPSTVMRRERECRARLGGST